MVLEDEVSEMVKSRLDWVEVDWSHSTKIGEREYRNQIVEWNTDHLVLM